MLSFLPSLTGVFSLVSAAPGLFLGLAIGVIGYRYMLIKNPNLLNTLVSKATTDIATIEDLLTKKRAVLPTAVVPVAPAVVPAPVVATPTPAPVAPVVVPAAVVVAPVVTPVPPAVPVEVAPAPAAVAVAPVAAPVAPAA